MIGSHQHLSYLVKVQGEFVDDGVTRYRNVYVVIIDVCYGKLVAGDCFEFIQTEFDIGKECAYRLLNADFFFIVSSDFWSFRDSFWRE